jgi:hypothetical protein
MIDISLQYQHVSFDNLKIDRQELYLLMGYGNKVPDQPFLDLIDGMLNELSGCCTPEYGYVIHPGQQIDNEHLQIGEAVLQPGKIITSSVREAEFFAVFVATVGKGFDRWNQSVKSEDDMVRTFFADSLGSVLAEACTMVMLERIECEMSAQGLFVSNSYSPGYCDWKLTEQRKIFSFFPEQFCGVTLLDSCLMLPIKSISGLIGIGKKVKKRLYACEVCTMENCVKKRKNNNKCINDEI